MRKNNLILSLLSVLISSFFIVSCVSTNQENVNKEKPNLLHNKIDDYNIEISGTKNIKYVYFYGRPAGVYFSNAPVDNNFIKEIISNISFLIGNSEYYLKFSDYDKNICVYAFFVTDEKGRKVQVFDNDKIILKSKKALSFSEFTASAGLKIGERGKYPYNCLVGLDKLSIAKNTKAEQEKIDLAREIISKKYGFKNTNAYINWLKRVNWENLYKSLSAGAYANTIPFVEGDIIFMKENLLIIEDMSYTNSGYLYLVSADKNQISRCCMIISPRQLNYINSWGARITESLVLRFEGKNQYQRGYHSQSCDVFTVIERNSKEYNEYMSKLNDMLDIEKNPYAYSDILK